MQTCLGKGNLHGIMTPPRCRTIVRWGACKIMASRARIRFPVTSGLPLVFSCLSRLSRRRHNQVACWSHKREARTRLRRTSLRHNVFVFAQLDQNKDLCTKPLNEKRIFLNSVILFHLHIFSHRSHRRWPVTFLPNLGAPYTATTSTLASDEVWGLTAREGSKRCVMIESLLGNRHDEA